MKFYKAKTMATSSGDETLSQIAIIKEENKPAVQQFIKQYFHGREPVTESLNRKASAEMAIDERIYTPIDVVDEGLSMMATTASGHILGVVLSSSFRYSKNVTENIEWNANTLKLINLMMHFGEQAARTDKIKNLDDKEMTVRVIIVRPELRRKGIGVVLLERVIELAKQNGFTRIRAVCTSHYSASLFEKLGFECTYSMRYDDYKENGESVIKPQLPHNHLKSMVFII